MLAQQFIAAVEYCHLHCVAHRDLKLDNTLLDDSNPPVIKLCDFGFAKTWTDDANMYTHIGWVQLSNANLERTCKLFKLCAFGFAKTQQTTTEGARTPEGSVFEYLQTLS